MASYFSDHYAALTANTTLLPNQVNSVAKKGSRVRYIRSELEFTGAFAINEVARMFDLKSSDRLIQLFLTTDDLGTVGSLNIGLYLSGSAHDGAVVDLDCFATAVLVTSAVARTDVLLESTTFAIETRGKELFRYAALTVDPVVQYDIAIVANAATDAAGTVVLEALYLAGD